MLNFTIAAMAARLTANIRRFQMLLPRGRINTSAAMHVPVTMRNMRSRRLIL